MELLKTKKGFSLAEIIISIGLFSILFTFLINALVSNNEQLDYALYKRQAIFLAEEGLEATRNIRDDDYANISAGIYGISENNINWSFSGSSDQVGDFTRAITITEDGADRRNVSVDVSWDNVGVQNGSVVLVSKLTNWMVASAGGGVCAIQADAANFDASGAVMSGGDKNLGNIFINNTDVTCSIEIASATLDWTTAGAGMNRVRLAGSTIWTGSVASGVEADVTNTEILNTDGVLDLSFRFDTKMKNDTFNITIKFTDGSEVTETNIFP